jgi:hypothetical protein
VKGGVKRSFFDLKNVIRDGLDMSGDSIAVQRPAAESFQDEEIQRTLQALGQHATHGIGLPEFDTSKSMPRISRIARCVKN